jgi:hypothetical protein
MRRSAFVVILGLFAAIAFADDKAAIPEKLLPPKGQVALLELKAKGVQIYECKAKPGQAGEFEWVFKAPEAELFDSDGKKVGRHYAGPTWEAKDGSKVVGKLVEKAAAPKEDDIPWLLLKATANEGKGVFSKVEYIQRRNTRGGNAPARPDKSQVGKTVKVPYEATYVFFGLKK